MVSWLTWLVVLISVSPICLNQHHSNTTTNYIHNSIQKFSSSSTRTTTSTDNQIDSDDLQKEDGTYSNSSNPYTDTLTEAQKELVSDQVKNSLLSMLGLKARPRIRNNVQVPSFMIEMYNRHKRAVEMMNHANSIISSNSSETDDDLRQEKKVLPNSVRSFTHTEVRSTVKNSISEVHLYFNVSSIPHNEELQNAELRLVHKADNSSTSFQDKVYINDKSDKKHKHWSRKEEIYLQRVTVFDVVRPARKTSPDPVLRILDTCLVDTRTSGSFTLDVSDSVKKWHRNPRLNYGLIVEVKPSDATHRSIQKKTNHIRLRRDVTSPEQWKDEQPFLLTYANEHIVVQRPKRSRPKDTMCRRYNLMVDFRAVRWHDWILAPPGYKAYYCKGECRYPLADHLDPTNHAVVQTLVHSTYHDRVPPACCVPTELSAISMLYIDEHEKVVLKTYQDMVVEKCGCR